MTADCQYSNKVSYHAEPAASIGPLRVAMCAYPESLHVAGDFCGYLGDGEEDLKGRALIDRAFHVNVTAMFANDSEGDGQSETRSFSNRLGGEKRIEYVREDMLRNAQAGVGEFNFEAIFLFGMAGGNAQVSAFGHGVQARS